MDFRLTDGDSVIDSSGKAERITGEDELLQRAYICIAVKKGSFIYNRELGSEIHLLNKSDDRLADKLLLVMNEAIMDCKGVTVQIIKISGGKVTVKLTCGSKSLERVINF